MLSKRDFSNVQQVMIGDIAQTRKNVINRLNKTKSFLNNSHLYTVNLDRFELDDELEDRIELLKENEKVQKFVNETLDGFIFLNPKEKECIFYLIFVGKTKSQLKSGIWINDEFIVISNIYVIWEKILDKLIFAYSHDYAY